MRKLAALLSARLPLEFRVLFRQFLLRVVDLEALSIEADIPRFLGQFAGVLIMYSGIQLIGALWLPQPLALAWHVEQAKIADVMLIVGLCSVLTWDTIFPDRRDIMVLAPLPVHPRMILLTKVAASAALLGLAVVSLNCASGLGWAIDFGAQMNGFPGILRFFACYWFTMAASALFIFAAVLTVQGFLALALPRRVFMRVSAILQLAAFGLFLGTYFLLPSLDSYNDAMDPAHHWLVAGWPTLWFLALFNQLNGTLPGDLSWVARRAWIALGLVALGATASLMLSYLRTMKKTVEEPDLVPGSGGRHWIPQLGSPLQTAIVLFSMRAITRSRQHRVALAFFWSVVFSITLLSIRQEWTNPPGAINTGFLMSTFMMMTFAVLGLRAVFSLPISLNANWILRVTQLRPTEQYIACTRRCLLLYGALPTWLISAALSLHYRPWAQVAEHIALLTLLGWILVETALIKLDKVPFTCSYLPGKTNIQVIFWGFVFVFIILGLSLAAYEQEALENLPQLLFLMACGAVLGVSLFWFNRAHAKSAVLYFEELPTEIITRLGLISVSSSEPDPRPTPLQ